MNLYIISQNVNSQYDTFDSAVVAAETPDDARKIHPDNLVFRAGRFKNEHREVGDREDDWVDLDQICCIKVELVGTTTKPKGVILSSFNAG